MPDVYISYTKEDRAAALVTQQELTARGASVFVSENSIEAGAQWPERLTLTPSTDRRPDPR